MSDKEDKKAAEEKAEQNRDEPRDSALVSRAQQEDPQPLGAGTAEQVAGQNRPAEGVQDDEQNRARLRARVRSSQSAEDPNLPDTELGSVNDPDGPKRAEPEDAVEMNVVNAFTFQHQDGNLQHFTVGRHKVPPHVADHWFAKAHTDDPPPPELKAGTVEYADAQRRAKQRQSLAEAALEQEVERHRLDKRAELREKLVQTPVDPSEEEPLGRGEPQDQPPGTATNAPVRRRR